MKKFYSQINTILKNQSTERQAFIQRKNEISESTATNERKKFDLEARTAKYKAYSSTNKELFEKAIEEKRIELESQLNTWKHSSNPALTNLLLILSASGNNLTANQVISMAEPFKDDHISINAIKAAAQSSGVNSEGLKELHSDLGENPQKVLKSFEDHSYNIFSDVNAFGGGNALEQNIRLTERGLTGEDISNNVTPGGSVFF